jgi:hypothetical protein
MSCFKCGATGANFLTQSGLFCGECNAALPKVCDFCCSPGRPPAWCYPGKDFAVIENISQSVGGWLACERCHNLIEARKFVELCDRSMKSFLKKHPIARRDKRIIRAEIARMHNDFRTHRAADPYRIDH